MHSLSHHFQTLAAKVSPQAFVRLMLLISGVWLLAVYPALNWFCWEKLPVSMRAGGSDFGQYYAGALAARHGLWQHLYPTPNQEIYGKPPQFKPLISTKLFDANAPEKRQSRWVYYPQVANPKGSTVAPEILAFCPRLQVDWHFMYPPPLAVLLWPLGYFDHQAASSGIWFSLMCASFFGMAYFSSRICRILWKRATYLEGMAAILPLIPTFLGSNMSTTLAVGNVSPFLGFLIVLVTYAWVSNRQVAIGFGIIPLLLFKGIGLTWCPLLLVKPIKWKTIGVLAALTLLLNGITLYYGGTELYRTFLADMVPKANIAVGISLQGLVMMFFGADLKPYFSFLSLLLIGGIYWGYWRQSRATEYAPSPSVVIATIAGTMAVFCLCNGVVWPNYYTNYLLLPFSGWILWEGVQAKGAWRKWIFGMFALSFVFWVDQLFFMKDSWLMEWLKHAGFYNQHIGTVRSVVNNSVLYLFIPLEFCFILALAYRRLFFAPQAEEDALVGGQADSHRGSTETRNCIL